MLRRCLLLSALLLTWGGTIQSAAAQHEHSYEFDGTHVAISIDRFMGIEYVDPEGPNNGDARARIFLNADDGVPSSSARLGVDVFLHRLSLGLAGGATSEGSAIIAPRVGYLFGLTPQLGFWLRGGAFYAALPGPGDPSYFGIYADALLGWFPYSRIAFTFGPSIDFGFGSNGAPDYISLGIPQMGLSVFF